MNSEPLKVEPKRKRRRYQFIRRSPPIVMTVAGPRLALQAVAMAIALLAGVLPRAEAATLLPRFVLRIQPGGA